MFLGHYGIAFAAKRAAPRTSLGTLAFAAQFLDELWPILLLLGVERLRVAPGLMSASAMDFVSYPWSHSLWILDAPMHRPDLPLWPGSSILVGGGLWNSKRLTLLTDGGIFVVGLLIYLRTTRSRDAIGRWGLWAMVALLLFVFIGAIFGPPPTDERAVAWSALLLWLFVPWSWWIDRHREMVSLPRT
jgi:hypothetical protein